MNSQTIRNIEMVLVWDMPSIIYPVGSVKCFKYYTDIFGKENAALKIVDFSFQNFDQWENDIFAWQQPILDDPYVCFSFI